MSTAEKPCHHHHVLQGPLPSLQMFPLQTNTLHGLNSAADLFSEGTTQNYLITCLLINKQQQV